MQKGPREASAVTSVPGYISVRLSRMSALPSYLLDEVWTSSTTLGRHVAADQPTRYPTQVPNFRQAFCFFESKLPAKASLGIGTSHNTCGRAVA